MSELTAENKKQLQTAAYCIDAMLSGEELSYEINASAVSSIECLDELNDAIIKGKEITFEGSQPKHYINFATLSDEAKAALSMLWNSTGSMTYSNALRKVLVECGNEAFTELNNLLKRK